MSAVGVGSVADVRERPDLVARAAAETGTRAHAIDWPALEALEDDEALVVIVARRRGLLVGYACAMLTRELWDRDQRVGLVLSMFLDPERRGVLGVRMFRRLAAEVADRGIDVLRVPAVPGSSLARMLRRDGPPSAEAFDYRVRGPVSGDRPR